MATVRAKVKPMTPGISHAARIRAYVTGAVLTLALCGVAVRAWGLQIEDGGHYRALAERQHAMTIGIPAPRGDILDGRGRPLAVSTDADSVWANPHDIKDVTETAEALAKLLGDDERMLEAKLAGDHKFVWLARHVTPEVAHAVREAKLAGVEVATEPRRWYPGRAVAGAIVGRADIDGKGTDGVEYAMNAVLAGKRSAVSALRDVHGRAMLADGLAPAEPGATVHLSLDRSIQAISDDALAEAITRTKAKTGVVVVLDVETSRVLALSSYPTFDPNAPDAKVARNKTVADVFEAGSVMKVFSVAAALDAGVVQPDTMFDLQWGELTVGGRAIHDVEHDPALTVAGIVKRSSNVGAAKIALRLGAENLYAGLKKFGFGGKTGIELPGERLGTLHRAAEWREIDLAHIAYGYGLTATPLQIAAALAAIGHGGLYTEPRVVDQVVDADGTVLYAAEPAQHQAIGARTASQMITILASVFDKDIKGKGGGTAKNIDVPGFKCGGKTGTAHKYDPETKQYSADHYLGSFAGLAPIDHPRIAVVAMIDDPGVADYFGASVAGPVFATVTSQTLRYLGVPGDALPDPSLKPGQLPKPVAAAKPTAPPKPIAAPPQPPVAAEVDIAVPADGSLAIPDVRGLGIGKALAAARKAGVAVEIAGSGHVVTQDPPPGPAPTGTHLVLQFSDDETRTPSARPGLPR